jgi:hypothetical protein
MSFSMPSYLLGVGTVVGALTLGFGGGVLLTKTAIKDSPGGPSRIERAARAETSAPQVQVTEARPLAVPRADPPAAQAAPEPVRQIQDSQVQAAAEPKPVPETKPVAEAAKPEPAKAAEPVRQADAPAQIEQKLLEPAMSGREQRRAEREQRRAERRMARERYYAERKARAMEQGALRLRVIEQPARPELAFEREERKPDLFEGLFGKPADAARDERE